MIDAYALFLSASLWTAPGSAPCATDAGNPCWTAAHVPAPILEARADGRFRANEICDGDLIRNSGARNGVAFSTGLQTAAFDVAYLEEAGLRYTTRDERTCIPSMSYGVWHDAEACGNRVRMVRRAGAPLIPEIIAYRPAPRVASGHVSFTRVGNLPPLTSHSGGARARVEAPPLITPLPGSVWLLAGALGALIAMKRKRA